MRADDARNARQSAHRDAKCGTDGLATVGADQVLRAYGQRLAGGEIANGCRHALGVLRQGRKLVVEAQLAGRALFRMLAQQRLEPELRIIARRAGTVARVERRDLATAKSVDFVEGLGVQRTVTAERSAPAHLAHILHRRTDGIDRIRHAMLAEHFHGALIEIVRLGQDRGACMTFNQQMVDAEIGQQQRTRQSARASPDDQYRDFDVKSCGCHGHECAPDSLRAGE